jgi:hypothetical protein
LLSPRLALIARVLSIYWYFVEILAQTYIQQYVGVNLIFYLQIPSRSRYWIVAKAGLKTTELFAKVTKTAWQWAKASQYIRWFTDGERPYAQQLWQMASVRLKSTEVSREYGHQKVW